MHSYSNTIDVHHPQSSRTPFSSFLQWREGELAGLLARTVVWRHPHLQLLQIDIPDIDSARSVS